MKSGRRALAAGAFLALLAACASPSPPRSAADSDLRRVAVLAPAAAEMLEALGLLDRVVAVGDFGPWPSGLAGRPSLGGYDSPNLERALELGVDLVLTAESEAAAPGHARLRAVGVRVEPLDTSTWEGIFASLARVGALFGREDETAAIARRMEAEIAEVASRAAPLPKRRVLFVVGRDPLFVAGPGSHVDRMIALAGGTNVAHDALAAYQQLSLETALERMPEVIIDTSDNRPGAPRGAIAGPWESWPFLPAVRDGRVYWVEPGALVIPGLRLPKMTRLVGKLVHPEIFGEATQEELGAGMPY